ncbi:MULTISPECIES: D-alanyl-D-alanine carboxypeptidase family protein [unclassified Treponema]|uniref:D-alanyl-D-alanine carboxypeptidase family protein n=1 Tax=unclassified Treponema TaxID=2638727 RepID=UPI0020A4865B|nr:MULTISPECIES: D-alanyl-D-alanine carboxypeptidase family protein [unclassified Treponema]UTC66215.1 D-alanyl-D-alanine carboxypeptidase [Treponema sp. OMZ 789]UTC68944.1 D-alanyl-D-alanine carboxypeptidase [Treponema sp. OMZ 790]UTC71671.1 D-alanyl-D-alanine carboxypeptidase [Treponema sp. OMZ 791]
MKRSAIIIKFIFILFAAALFCALGFAGFIFFYVSELKKAEPLQVSSEQAERALDIFYKEHKFNAEFPPLNSIENFLPVQDLPSADAVKPADIELPQIDAESYILIHAKTGTILAEHNADKQIPPASLTKLVTIYTMLQNPEFKRMEKRVSPPKEAWAVFLPRGAAWMGLGENQNLSVEELIRGMAVCSGNDAALAAAILTEGSLKKFTLKMNEAVKKMGLKSTCFEDSSGLSEKNQTSAKDFALFSLHYLKRYPENLKKFHSLNEISYPQEHNIFIKKNSSGLKQFQITKPATNTLLKKLEGCDGLKTGFIYESGFNISLTAQKNGERFIAVILGGHWKNLKDGVSTREQNSIKLMNFAFDNFTSLDIREHNKIEKAVKVLGSNLNVKNSAIIPVLANLDFSQDYITVLKNDEGHIERVINLPATIKAPISAGRQIGSIEYRIKDSGLVLKTIPLLCPIDIKEGSSFRKFIDGFFR